jgi:hypothetical protein
LLAFCNAGFLLSPAGSSLLVAFGFSIRAVELLMMLLNVGVPVSAIQFIVFLFSIDVIDKCPRQCRAGWVRSTTRRENNQERSSLQRSDDLVRKTGCHHEMAPRSILLRFET